MVAAKQAPLKAAKAIAVDDEEMAVLEEAVRKARRKTNYHGLELDVFHRGYGAALVWPADKELVALAREAFAEEDLEEPTILKGFEADYLAAAEAEKRGIERAAFTGRWNHDRGFGFFVVKKDALASQAAFDAAAKQLRFNPARQSWGGEEEDDED
jgi:hypothetical protein